MRSRYTYYFYCVIVVKSPCNSKDGNIIPSTGRIIKFNYLELRMIFPSLLGQMILGLEPRYL